MATTKNPSSSHDPTEERVTEYSNLSLQQVDEAHRIDGIAGPALHVENELDAFGREQEPLWEAEGVLQAHQRLQQGRQRKDRKSQDQRNSEPLPEIRCHVRVVALVTLGLIRVFMLVFRRVPLTTTGMPQLGFSIRPVLVGMA